MRLLTLKNRSDFIRMRSGRKTHKSAFLLQSLGAELPGAAQFGFTVTKRVGNAVERNRIRRRLRSAVSACLGKMSPVSGDHVLIGKRDALTIPFAELVSDLEFALKQIANNGKRSSQ